MLRGSIKLYDYDLKFAPRTTIKVQALFDFLAELSFTKAYTPEGPMPSPIKRGTWMMMVDGAVNSQGVWVDVTLKSPSG